MAIEGDMPTSRRARLRAETAREIKTTALRLMREGGPQGITLRAIARAMGMTAGAIYGYYDTRDALVTALIRDEYEALVDTVDGAVAAAGDEPAARIMAWGDAYRAWAHENGDGYRLIFGDGVPGYRPPHGGAAPEAEQRACAGLVRLLEPAEPASGDAIGSYSWGDFDPHVVAITRAAVPALSPADLARAMRFWARVHGLVSLELYGHLATQPARTAALFRDELEDIVAWLGLARPGGR